MSNKTKRELEEKAEALAIAERIRHKIKARGSNATKISVRAGMHPPTITRMLTEGRNMKATNIAKIAVALNCSSDELLGIVREGETQLDRARKVVAQLDNILWGEK